MADKYPSLTPYNYCAWNPIKLVDPDGEEIDDYKLNTKTGSLILIKKTNDDFDFIEPDNGGDAMFVSKGILNGKNIGDDVSKRGFQVTNGKQDEGIRLMKYISFTTNIELSAWGYNDNKGKACLDVDAWGNNTAINAKSNNMLDRYKGKGVRTFHVHIHPGTKDGKSGYGRPSEKDKNFAKKIPSQYYIISRKNGLTQYNKDGKYWVPSKEKTPTSLLPYRKCENK